MKVKEFRNIIYNELGFSKEEFTQFETKEHILEWIDKLKQQIAEIEIPDEESPNLEQEIEACYKLSMYLNKLQLHEYTEMKEKD